MVEKLYDYLKKKYLPENIHIGYCNQHILHEAFQTAIQSSGWNIDKVFKLMYPARLSSEKGNLVSRRWWKCIFIEVINLSYVLIVHCF